MVNCTGLSELTYQTVNRDYDHDKMFRVSLTDSQCYHIDY